MDTNQISSLEPLAGLTDLRQLSLENSPEVRSLVPLAGLKTLESITCSGTQITSLEPLKDLPQLKEVISIDCPIQAIPEWVTEYEMLGHLCVSTKNKQPIGDMPVEVFSKDKYDNCLPRLREWRGKKTN